jgi:hypothetical protein
MRPDSAKHGTHNDNNDNDINNEHDRLMGDALDEGGGQSVPLFDPHTGKRITKARGPTLQQGAASSPRDGLEMHQMRRETADLKARVATLENLLGQVSFPFLRRA